MGWTPPTTQSASSARVAAVEAKGGAHPMADNTLVCSRSPSPTTLARSRRAGGSPASSSPSSSLSSRRPRSSGPSGSGTGPSSPLPSSRSAEPASTSVHRSHPRLHRHLLMARTGWTGARASRRQGCVLQGVSSDWLRARVPPSWPDTLVRWRCSLQVFWRESCVLRDSGEHSGAQFLAIVKGEHVVGPTRAREGPMGTRLALDRPANTLQR
jgi:hypothetical protein